MESTNDLTGHGRRPGRAVNKPRVDISISVRGHGLRRIFASAPPRRQITPFVPTYRAPVMPDVVIKSDNQLSKQKLFYNKLFLSI